jgi:transitional endoplasmic reticulum ATPase
VFGRVDLDGTHRALVESAEPLPGEFTSAEGGPAVFVKITLGARVCACTLAKAVRGPTSRLIVDRFKQRQLWARDGVEVGVEVVQLPEAQGVVLQVSGDLSDTEIRRFRGKPLTRGEKTVLFSFAGEARSVEVSEINPGVMAVVTSTTEVRIGGGQVAELPLGWVDIGDLTEAKRKIRESIEYPLRFPGIFERLGISGPKGIILHGPPGTGKTLLARALANEAGASYYCVSGPELFSKFYGETEAGIRRVFDEAAANAPAVLVIDELDALVPNRAQAVGETERRAVATFLAIMDGVRELRGVVVIGTTNRIDAIDPALRRGGRFEHEIHIGVPDPAGRLEILRIHTRRMPLASDVDLKDIAARAVGFVGADIASLCREAAYNALRRAIPPEAFERGGLEVEPELFVHAADFSKAVRDVLPSAMREFMVEMPETRWADIGGLDEVKNLLIESVAQSVGQRGALAALGLRPTRGVLLYGPPGTGKTLLGRAAAHECGANFINIRGPEIRSKWYGESEARIRAIFDRARQCAPCIIFFDEIDAVAGMRSGGEATAADRVDASIVNQILAEMDGVQSADGVLVLGATNQPSFIDPALLRPGRFDFQIEVPLPDPAGRRAVFGVHLDKKPLAEDVSIEAVVELTHGFSGAEIEEACREATLVALRESDFDLARTRITMAHLRGAIAGVTETGRRLKPRRLGFIVDEQSGPLEKGKTGDEGHA